MTSASFIRCRSMAVRFLYKHKTLIRTIGRKYRKRGITCNIRKAMQRARVAELVNLNPKFLGLSTDKTVLISKNKNMKRNRLTGTIIHEALHYCYMYKRKFVHCRTEHALMKRLSESSGILI